MKSSDILRELGAEPAEVIQASDQDAYGTPPLRGVLGTSIWAQAPGQARESLEGLDSSLRVPQEELLGRRTPATLLSLLPPRPGLR